MSLFREALLRSTLNRVKIIGDEITDFNVVNVNSLTSTSSSGNLAVPNPTPASSPATENTTLRKRTRKTKSSLSTSKIPCREGLRSNKSKSVPVSPEAHVSPGSSACPKSKPRRRQPPPPTPRLTRSKSNNKTSLVQQQKQMQPKDLSIIKHETKTSKVKKAAILQGRASLPRGVKNSCSGSTPVQIKQEQPIIIVSKVQDLESNPSPPPQRRQRQRKQVFNIKIEPTSRPPTTTKIERKFKVTKSTYKKIHKPPALVPQAAADICIVKEVIMEDDFGNVLPQFIGSEILFDDNDGDETQQQQQHQNPIPIPIPTPSPSTTFEFPADSTTSPTTPVVGQKQKVGIILIFQSLVLSVHAYRQQNDIAFESINAGVVAEIDRQQDVAIATGKRVNFKVKMIPRGLLRDLNDYESFELLGTFIDIYGHYNHIIRWKSRAEIMGTMGVDDLTNDNEEFVPIPVPRGEEKVELKEGEVGFVNYFERIQINIPTLNVNPWVHSTTTDTENLVVININ